MNAQLTGVVVESASDGSIGSCPTDLQPAGTTTYRVYAELQDPTDFLVAVGANEGAVEGVTFQCHPLDISTTTTFFNSAAGANTGDAYNPLFCGFAADSGHDSWVTIGYDDNTAGAGVQSNWTNPIDPISPAFGPAPGASMTAEDGAYYALPGSANGFPVGPNNRVLIGQFTTDGDFSFNLNIAVLDEGVGGTNLYYPWNGNSGCVNLLNYQDVTGLGLTYPVAVLPGCTDVTACNYDAAATEDDGSCTFADPGFDCNGDCLAGVPLVIDITADEYAGENTWTLTEDGVEIASGGGTDQSVTVCVDPTLCYVFTMLDSFDDGQSGSSFGGVDGSTTLTLDGVEVFFETGNWGSEISYSTGCPIPGCTDVTAINYDAAANTDDGSCVTPGCVDAPINNVYCYDTGSVSFTWEETSPGAGVIIAINAGTFEACCDGLLIYDGADNTAPVLYNGLGVGDVAGVIAQSTGASITIEFNGDSSIDCQSGARVATDYDVYCGTIFGCTDVTADNYDANALTDDGSCLFGPIGCTDVNALNYDPAAVNDDGSCVVPACTDAPQNFVYCYDTGVVSFTYEEFVPGGGVVISVNSGTFETCCDELMIYDGADNTAPVLYDGSGVFDVSGVLAQSTGAFITIEFNGDISADCASGAHVATDYDVYCSVIEGCTDPTAANYDATANTDDGSCLFGVPGCTDLTACNYDAAATTDDGSCIFAEAGQDCLGNCLVGSTLVIDITADEYPGENTWTLTEDGVEIASGGGTDQSVTVCVDPTLCLVFTMLDSFDDGQSGSSFGGVDGSTTLTLDGVEVFFESGDWGSEISYSTGCPIPGCTDPTAANYDDTATVDDGSCVLCTGGLLPLVIDITTDEYPNENTWTLTEDGVEIASGGGTDQSVTVCVDPTLCYVFTMLDSFDDGQSGSSFGGVDGSTTLTLDGVEVFFETGNWGSEISYSTGPCPIPGCTDPAALNYDATATVDDGSCIITTLNETPALATPLTLNVATGPGAGCNGLSGEDMGAAQFVASEGVYQQVNPDLWYSFTPFSSGNRIQVITSDFDALIEVFDASMNLVTETSGITYEDDNFVDGDEIYHVGNLTAGQQYYIRVAPYFAVTGSALFDICVQTLRDSRCDYGAGPYSLCQLFKADFVYSDAYIFNFTSQNTGITYSSNPQTSTFLQLSNVPDLQFGDDYTVAIDAVYNFQDGGGNNVQVICENDEPCTMGIYTPNTISMRSQDNSVNHGPHFPGNYIRANSFVCSADRYSWRFTRTDVAELPVEYTTNTTSTWVRISDVLGAAAAAGGVYNVEVKPVFDTGQDLGYGTVQEITILGVAGIQGDVLTAAPQIEEAGSTKLELDNADAMVYPNPSTGDNITINLNNIDASAEQGVIEVTDFVGRTVASFQITLSGSTHQEVINLSHLASGTYLMNINVNGTVMTEKIVIAK
jgi:hypothetical protein